MGPRTRSGRFGEKSHFPAGIRTSDCASRNLVLIPTMPSWLQLADYFPFRSRIHWVGGALFLLVKQPVRAAGLSDTECRG